MVNALDDHFIVIWRKELRAWEPESVYSLGLIVQSISIGSWIDSLVCLGNNEVWSTRDLYSLIDHGGGSRCFWLII